MGYSQKDIHEIFQASNKKCSKIIMVTKVPTHPNTSQHPNWTLGELNWYLENTTTTVREGIGGLKERVKRG
jgi:hypothetical protein